MKDNEILSIFKTGWEFEFYTSFQEKDLVKSLKETLNKKIIVPRLLTGLNKKEMIVHNKEVTPTEYQFKLEKDYSGGSDMWELITGPMTFSEARLILVKFYKWLQDYGYTNSRCSNHMNISIEKMKNPLKFDILNLERLKFCLNFDEKYVYDRYPNRIDDVYAQSIKLIYPNNKFSFNDNIHLISHNSYKTPSTKYYGVNFIKQSMNYLEFRYVGGENYEHKLQEALDCHKHFCLSVFNVLKNPGYNESDAIQITNIMKQQKKIVSSFSNYEHFKLNYPEIILTVDLSAEEQIIKSRWSELKEVIYDLIIFCRLRKGFVNYDSIFGRYQIKDANMKDCNTVNSYEFVNCILDGLLFNCEFHNCTIKNSQLTDSKLIKNNSISNSKIINTEIDISNKCYDCYIDNQNVIISGKIEKSIIRNGNISKNAIIDDKTLIVNAINKNNKNNKK